MQKITSLKIWMTARTINIEMINLCFLQRPINFWYCYSTL